MFCRNCGTQLDDSAKFCPSCGTPVVAVQGTAAAQPQPQPQPEPVAPQPEPASNVYSAPVENPYTQQVPPAQVPYQQPASYLVPAGAKSKIAAGLLAIFLGTLGIHKFYLGYTKQGIIMLLVSLLTFGIGLFVMAVIALVEGIIYLTKDDYEFYQTYEVGSKPWF